MCNQATHRSLSYIIRALPTHLMELYSSNSSQEMRRNSHGYRPPQTSQIADTEPSFTNFAEASTIIEANFAITSSSTAVGLYYPPHAQAQPSEVEDSSLNSHLAISATDLNQYSRLPRPYNAAFSSGRHLSLPQGPTFQSWDDRESGQEGSSTARMQADRGVEQRQPPARAGYGPGSEQPLQENMSIMAPQYFSEVETSLNRSSHTWPVFEQQQSYSSDTRYIASFNEQAVMSRTQSSPSTPPTLMSMSLPIQQESRQLHQGRRDTKTRFRPERSHSLSYNPSLSTTPEALPRTLALDSYPLAAPTSDPPQSRMPIQHYASSLQLPGTQQSHTYEHQYPLGMADYSDNYLIPYPPAQLSSSASSFSPRPLPASSISTPDLGTYYRQPSASSRISDQNQASEQGADAVRVVHTRPKPQCWEHGCNGRAFSTFSNLLRHQREKNGVASKPTCPHCGAEFTRTTARNGHMAHEKCKKA